MCIITTNLKNIRYCYEHDARNIVTHKRSLNVHSDQMIQRVLDGPAAPPAYLAVRRVSVLLSKATSPFPG